MLRESALASLTSDDLWLNIRCDSAWWYAQQRRTVSALSSGGLLTAFPSFLQCLFSKDVATVQMAKLACREHYLTTLQLQDLQFLVVG